MVGGVRLAALDGFTEHSHTLALERAIEVSVLHEQPGRRCAVVTDETFRRPAVRRHDLFHSRRRAQIDGAELGVEPLSPLPGQARALVLLAHREQLVAQRGVDHSER